MRLATIALLVCLTPPICALQITMLAKKGGGKKKKGGGGNQKQSGFAWASNFELKPFESSELRALADTVANAHQSRSGKPLHASLVGASDQPKKLWAAPVAVLVAKEAEGGAVCSYANRAALEAYGLGDSHAELIEKPIELPGTMEKKYESSYSKKIKGGKKEIFSFEGSRWALESVAVVDGALKAETIGVAYCFEEWVAESDGYTCRPGGERQPPEMTPEELEAAVTAQATEVRRLKDEGLGNKDPEVAAAVTELLRLKALLPPEDGE